MKTLRFLSLLCLCPLALATEYFSGYGTGAQRAYSYERDYTTPWINDLIAQIRANSNLTPTDRDNTLQVLDQLTQIAAQPGTSGTFSGNVGSSSGTMMINIERDYIVDVWHVPGTQYFVSLWLQAPSAPPPNRAPTISWASAPSSAGDGQGYTITAHGHDDDGNLTQVNVWKSGGPFAFSGGGNGYDNDSSNATSDSGPQNITFTAQAIDSSGATSPVISHTVTINGPANRAPTISWISAPSTAGNSQSYTISARGQDADGNLAQVNIMRNGAPFAFAGGGTGFTGDSGNATSDSGPQTITYTAQAVDASGAPSPVISHTITIGGPANRSPTIAWTSAPSSAANGQTYTVTAHGHDDDGNLTQVNVWKAGAPFAFAGGGNGYDSDSGNATTDGGPQTITFTAQAVDSRGSASPVISHTITIGAPGNRPPTITWLSAPATANHQQSYTITARAQDADGNLANVNVWKNSVPFAFAGGGSGFTGDSGNASADNGPQTITFTAQAFDASGAASAVITHTITINGLGNRAPTIAWIAAPSTANHQQAYTITARGQDADGNLANVNVWKNGVPFAFAAGGSGFSGDSGNATSDNGPQTITFTAQASDTDGASSFVITHTIAIGGPANASPTVTLLSPSAQTVSTGTTLTLSSRAIDSDGDLIAHNLDIQRPAGDWNFQGGFATGAPFQGGPVGSASDSTRSANFTFTDPGTYYIRGAAIDDSAGAGWMQSSTVAITVVTPPPSQYTLTMSAAAGGTVSPGGTFGAGAVATVTALPDAIHDFAGWTGDASGAANPLSVFMDRNKTVTANFALKMYPLTTSATAGGSVTPGGNYPHGTTVTLSATPDINSRFTGWTGDASGAFPSIAVTMNGPRAVNAVFASKAAQTISFTAPADRSAAAAPFQLSATASSGLPVSYTVLSGPATVTADQLQLIGPGVVTVQATQPGDAFFLPAPSVTRAFNAIAPVVLKYRGAARTLLQSERTREPTPFVLEQP